MCYRIRTHVARGDPGMKNTGCRLAMLDWPKSGTIGKVFVRSSTAICFLNFDVSFEYFDGVQKS
jgi:hypothetical protein